MPRSLNATARIFITSEDPESIDYQADYPMGHYLGGATIWHLSTDAAGVRLLRPNDQLVR